jgi:hypothetical protein
VMIERMRALVSSGETLSELTLHVVIGLVLAGGR